MVVELGTHEAQGAGARHRDLAGDGVVALPGDRHRVGAELQVVEPEGAGHVGDGLAVAHCHPGALEPRVPARGVAQVARGVDHPARHQALLADGDGVGGGIVAGGVLVGGGGEGEGDLHRAGLQVGRHLPQDAEVGGRRRRHPVQLGGAEHLAVARGGDRHVACLARPAVHHGAAQSDRATADGLGRGLGEAAQVHQHVGQDRLAALEHQGAGGPRRVVAGAVPAPEGEATAVGGAGGCFGPGVGVVVGHRRSVGRGHQLHRPAELQARGALRGGAVPHPLDVAVGQRHCRHVELLAAVGGPVVAPHHGGSGAGVVCTGVDRHRPVGAGPPQSGPGHGRVPPGGQRAGVHPHGP